ncbi:MAG: metallophosphoesterase [Paludibacteraceae bacterium]
MKLGLLTFLFAIIISGIICLTIGVLYLIVKLIAYALSRRKPTIYPFIYVAVILLVTCWGLISYGYWVGRYRIEVKQTAFVHPLIPSAFEGYKIVHISDLHLATFADRPAALQRIVDSINAQTPDMICFTGDILTMGVEEALPFRTILRQLHARDGIYAVLGNHDLMIYGERTSQERTQLVNTLVAFEHDSLGWNVLRDTSDVVVREQPLSEGVIAYDTLTILGVDNCSCEGQGFRSIYHGDLSAAMRNTGGFRILLSHDPTHWRAEVQDHTNIPLTLSGHTHSGQLRIFGHPLAGLLFQESAGWYYHPACDEKNTEKPQTDEKRQALYINSGVGCTLPVRVNCPAEITVITLAAE